MNEIVRAAITEIVSEIANEFGMAADRKERFVGFQPDEYIGVWVDEMIEWMLIIIEKFSEDSTDVEDALDEIRVLVYRLFESNKVSK